MANKVRAGDIFQCTDGSIYICTGFLFDAPEEKYTGIAIYEADPGFRNEATDWKYPVEELGFRADWGEVVGHVEEYEPAV
jgi:hypothetical protein